MGDHLLIRGDARRIPLADGSVHCVVTSPPYFGLRDYGSPGQIGLEPSPAEYVAAMVGVFRELRRVLRDDGTVWLNVGDSYASGGRATRAGNSNGMRSAFHKEAWSYRPSDPDGIKPKDLLMIPARLAIALQDDGWYLRAECVWHKPNPMPESVTDRPTRAHEMVYLLTKRERYYYDQGAERIPFADDRMGNPGGGGQYSRDSGRNDRGALATGTWNKGAERGGANLRSVWTITTKPLKAAHFATMPPDLAARCIRLGTSERGCCPSCGSPWRRITESERVATRPGVNSKVYAVPPVSEGSPYRTHKGDICGNRDPLRHVTETRTVGWSPTCGCAGVGKPLPPIPCTVFDPFSGAGTTPLVAVGLGRHGIGTDLSRDYLLMARRRIERPHARPVRATRDDEPLPLFAPNGADHHDHDDTSGA